MRLPLFPADAPHDSDSHRLPRPATIALAAILVIVLSSPTLALAPATAAGSTSRAHSLSLPPAPSRAFGSTELPSASGEGAPAAVVDVRELAPVSAQPPYPLPAGPSRTTGTEPLTPTSLMPKSEVSPSAGWTVDPTSQVRVGAGFEGVDSSQCGCSPPDVQAAVGPSQVVEMVNVAVEIWGKDGTPVATAGLSSFFHSGGDGIGDPRVYYDNGSGRWFASVYDFGSSFNSIRFAVSQSSDAAGNWTVYTMLHAPAGNFTDQPILGVSDDLVGFSANDFWNSGNGYAGGEYWVVNKTELLQGTTASWTSFGPDPNALSIHPVRSLTSTPDQYFVMTAPWNSPTDVSVYRVSGVPPGTVNATVTNLTVAGIAYAPGAPQKGSSSLLDTGDPRVSDALYEDGAIWLGFAEGCIPAGDTSTRSCARLLELTTNPIALAQDITLAVNQSYLFYPAVSTNAAGDLTAVFALSSASNFPTIAVVGQVHTAPRNSTSRLAVVFNGSSPLTYECGTYCRYGDYFAAAPDPSSPQAWVAGEWSNSSSSWLTYLAPVLVLGPTSARLSVLPSTADAGSSVTVSWSLRNSTCVGGASNRCLLYLPFGDGTSAVFGCSSPLPTSSTTHVYASAGNYSIGLGGYLATYSGSPCNATGELSNVSLSPVLLRVALPPSVSVLVATGHSVDVGQPVSFLAQASLGVPPYSYAWTSLPTGCVDSGGAWENCTPTSAGFFTVRVTVTDQGGGRANGSVVYSILPAPAVDLSANASILDVGGSVAFLATATLGTGIFSFAWSGLPAGCVSSDSSVLVCSPTSAGSYPVSVTATDTNGANVTSGAWLLTVFPAPAVTVELSVSTVDAGTSMLLTANVSGGVGPFTYSWSGLPPGCASSNRSTLTCTPSASGAYTIHVAVRDAAGGDAASTASLTVSPQGVGTTTLLLIVVVIVAVAAVLGVALSLARRRRRPRAEERAHVETEEPPVKR